MTFGKITAWNESANRGLIEDRIGQTYRFERKDIVADFSSMVVGSEVAFESITVQKEGFEVNEAYAVESNSGQFRRFDAVVGHKIA